MSTLSLNLNRYADESNTHLVLIILAQFCRLLHLSKPGHSTGIVATAGAAAASLMSSGGGKTL